MNKKVGLIVLVVVLALGALGIGYAAWTQTLTITGSVQTGTLSAAFTAVDYTASDYGEDSASIGDGVDATITIDNAYPGFTNTYVFTVTNTGTVPVDISITETTDPDGIATGTGSATELIASGTADFTVVVTIPGGWDNDTQDSSYTVVYTLDVDQFNLP